jgi:hypothetical protein
MSFGDIDVAKGCTVRSNRHEARSIPHRSSSASEKRRCASRGKRPCRQASSTAAASAMAAIIGTSATLSRSKIATTSAVFMPGS